MVGEDLFEVMTLELRHEGSEGVCHVSILEKSISSGVNSMNKGPEAGGCVLGSFEEQQGSQYG